MNSDVSFKIEEKREMLSTPKFHINKSIYSIGRDENILDALKQNINNLLNVDNSCNEENINENKKDENSKELVLSSSLSNKKNSKIELNNHFFNQISFDEKSQNYIFLKNEKDSDINKENVCNNIILTNENENEFNHDDIYNNEIKYINNIDNFLIESNKKNANENSDTNFNYILPLESDKSSEQFNLISFQGYSDDIPDNKNMQLNKIQNQKKMAGEQKIYNNLEILNKKRGIGYLSKQNTNKDVKKEVLKLTPQNKNKNNKIILKNQNMFKANSNNNIKKIKIPSLIEEYRHNRCLTEPNEIYLIFKGMNNSQKNTFFTSNDNKENGNKKENIITTPIKEDTIVNPFIIGKINSENNINHNDNDNEITKKEKKENNVIKKMTIFKKVGLKNRNSINYVIRKNKFINNNIDNSNENKNSDGDDINIIYEKNLEGKENSPFSINQIKQHKLIHTRNSSLVNQSNYTYDHSSINQKIKNCIFLLSQKNMKNSPMQTRQNSSGNHSISASDSSTQRTLKKIKEGKCSPFYKSKINEIIINKKQLSKKFIFTQSSSSSFQSKKSSIKMNKNNEKYEDDNIFISSNKNKNNKVTIFCNYDSKKVKKDTEKANKKKKMKIGIEKIKVNTINSNNLKNIKLHLNKTCYMGFKPKNEVENIKGNLTERNRDLFIRHSNIYSKKLVFPTNNNTITNLYSSINNDSNNRPKIKKNNTNIFSSIIKRKKKNLSMTENNSHNNSIMTKEKINFHKYFNQLLSNIDLNKKENNKETNFMTLNNMKKNNKTRNHTNLLNIGNNTHTQQAIYNNILYSKNSYNHKSKYEENKKLNNTTKIKECNTKNNSINLGSNNKFKVNKITKKKVKISYEKIKPFNVANFKNNIVKYAILRNNENNKMSSEISIYIGKQTKNNSSESNNNTDMYNSNSIKNKNEKISLNNNKMKSINVNKKTIINVNQFYPSYFINNNNDIFKNKNSITSYI
jgi:hypothetical protein